MSKKAVFLDRDGTVTIGVPKYERVDSLDKVALLPKTIEALEFLAKLNYLVFFITNQAGLAEGLIDWEEFDQINGKMLGLISPSRIKIEKSYVCPHGEQDNCACRKPKPKLLFDAAHDYDIDLSRSWMIGDRPSDVMAGINAGTRAILVLTGVPTVSCDQATATVPSLLEAIEYIAEQS